jgi:hypothetical protein
MSGLAQLFDPGKTKVRFGLQACPQLAATDLPFDGLVVSEEVRNNPETIQPATITGQTMADPPLPGLAPAGGALEVEIDAESFFPFLAQAQQADDVVDASPVFTHTLSPLATGVDLAGVLITLEIFRDDGMPQRTVDCLVSEFNLTVAVGELLTGTITLLAGWADYWDDALLRAPLSADAPASVIGLDSEDAWATAAGPLTIRAEEIIPATSSTALTTKVVVKRGPEQVLSGTWTVGAGTNSFAGSGGAALTELSPGDYIDVIGELLEVDVITDDDTFTTVGNHTAGATAELLVETFGPFESTLPRWLHATKGNVQYGTLLDSRTGLSVGDRATGNKVELYFDAEALTDPPAVTLTGTVTHTISANTLAGVGTLFLTELALGQIVNLGDSIVHRIATITDDVTATTVQDRVGATAAGVALTVPPHWDVQQFRPDWVSGFTEAPVFNGIAIEVFVDDARFDAQSVNFVITPPAVATSALGTRRATQVKLQGIRNVAANFDRAINDAEMIRAAELSSLIKVQAVATGAKEIPTTQTPYSMTLTAGNCTVTSPRETITAAGERIEAVTTEAGRDPGGTFPEDLEIVVVNSIPEAAITPPTP